MENQHRKIKGYRELNQDEIDLMNEIKELGPKIEDVLLKVNSHINKQILGANNSKDIETIERLDDATPHRFSKMAKTDFQTALMYLTRAVAQPTFF